MQNKAIIKILKDRTGGLKKNTVAKPMNEQNLEAISKKTDTTNII